MPEFQVHGKCGRRGEVGSLRDGDGGALEIGNGGRVHLGNKVGVAISLEVHEVMFNGDGEVLPEREVEDREEVGSEIWDIEDI